MKIISFEPLQAQWMDRIEKQSAQHIQYISREEMDNNKILLQEAQILICRDRDLSKELLDDLESLEWIFIVSTGVDKLPFEAIKGKGIKVANSPSVSNEAMSDYTIGAMLLFSCQFKKLMEYQKDNYWKPYAMTTPLKGQNLLIVGAGKIGQAIAAKAKAFDMHIYGICRTPKEIEGFEEVGGMDRLESFSENADFIVCTLPLTSETRYLFNADIFTGMKESAIFINISRGALVDTEALIEVLEKRQIAGAVLDVFEKEPLPMESRLWDLDNVVLTPHSSGRISNYLEQAMEIFGKNLVSYIEEGKLLNEVNLEKGY